MNALEEYYQVTKNAIVQLSEECWLEDRDAAIRSLDQLIDVREELQEKIKPPFTDEEKKIGQACVRLNEELNQLMTQRRTEVARDIHKVKQQKQTNDKYANPYESVITDGFYYDKRK